VVWIRVGVIKAVGVGRKATDGMGLHEPRIIEKTIRAVAE
jgi:hypothetical protein